VIRSGEGRAALGVLIVDGDRSTAGSFERQVTRLPGFGVLGTAYSMSGARLLLSRCAADLLLLDLCPPGGHGLDLVRALRAGGSRTDVIMLVPERTPAVLGQCVSLGVLHCLVKPVSATALRGSLLRYAAYRATRGEAGGQQDVDRVLALLRAPSRAAASTPPSTGTLLALGRTLREAGGDGVTVAAAARTAMLSRSTVRRCLEHMVDTGSAERDLRYGRVGRPEIVYRHAPLMQGTTADALSMSR
jgi:response regulator of citrate/malate metabolism